MGETMRVHSNTFPTPVHKSINTPEPGENSDNNRESLQRNGYRHELNENIFNFYGKKIEGIKCKNKKEW